MNLPFVVVGISHKTAPVEVRERFAAEAESIPQILEKLKARPELEEVMFLSTCNRVEIFARAKRGMGESQAEVLAEAAICDALRELVGAESNDEVKAYLYSKSGENAVKHIFRVAASLDSMVVGEPQILGQVKDAYDAAMRAKSLGSLLGKCVHRAFTVAKRIRTETALGEGSVSISSVAVDLARRIFGELEDHTVLLVGAGEMAQAAAKSLGKGARSIRVCNRSVERAALLASTFGGGAAPLDQLEDELVLADVVVASTASKQFVITEEMVKRVMKRRKGRTLFFVDIAVPRNVDPKVHSIDNAYVFNVDDLEEQVREGLKARHAEVTRAEEIVTRELTLFSSWVKTLDAQTIAVALREKTRSVLLSELEKTLAGKLKHLPEADRAQLTQMMESAANKLLHAPTTHLRRAVAESEEMDLLRAAIVLFELPEPKEDGALDDEAETERESADERVTH